MKHKLKDSIVAGQSDLKYSFSPSINNKIFQQKTIYKKDKNIFTCPKDYIKIIHNSTKESACVHFKEPEVQDIMLRNLLSKDEINCTNITAPKQLLANCWFNVFFMCFFISDKGRKFFRYLRQIMITGEDENKKKVIQDSARSIFFHLNLFIDSALQGNNLAKLMDTNEIIYDFYTQLKSNFPKVDEAWNPIEFYDSIIGYLKKDPHNILLINADTINQFPHKNYKKDFGYYVNKYNHAPNIIIIFINDDVSKMIKKKPTKFTIKYKSKKITYSLDSAIIRDINGGHFACCITCNKREYGFDGESFSRISTFAWKKRHLNQNKVWKFESPYDTYFNFKNGLHYLFYYRI